MKLILIIALFLSSPLYSQAGKQKQRGVTVNEVVQFIYQSEQEEIIKEINKGLRNKKIHSGKFFLGEIDNTDKVLGHAKMQNLPEVSAIENGFKFEIQKQVVTVEVKDILLGLVYVNGVKIKIDKKTTYSNLLRKINSVLLLKEKSSFSPIDLFIDKAHALWPVIGLAAVAGGVIVYGIDTIFSKVGHAINYDNKQAIKAFDEKMSKLDGECSSDLASLKDSGKVSKRNSSVTAVLELGDAIEEIEESLDDEDDKLIYCKELARKSKIEFESHIFKVDYDGLIKKGCDSMEKVHLCLIETKKYLEDNDIEVNKNYHELSDGDNFNPYVDAVKSAIDK
ncbi:MAG: hypothetical protein CME70_13100 [Halobacteriovorax sp.]|nr:hypothetical protein [Halobacteriovorax sp.]|tara:strand:+ start:114259 stop:115269 length:1011 start_codon:yes stop_codon:yes gene_type:complete